MVVVCFLPKLYSPSLSYYKYSGTYPAPASTSFASCSVRKSFCSARAGCRVEATEHRLVDVGDDMQTWRHLRLQKREPPAS